MKLIELLKKIAETTEVIVNESGYEIARYDGTDSTPNGLNNREVYEVREEDGAIVVELESVDGMTIGAYLEEFEVDTDTEVLIETIDGIPLQSGTAGEMASEWRRRKISETDTDEDRLVLRLGWGE